MDERRFHAVLTTLSRQFVGTGAGEGGKGGKKKGKKEGQPPGVAVGDVVLTGAISNANSRHSNAD